MPRVAGASRVEMLLVVAASAVARARRLATELGPDSSRAWDVLELAADVERAAFILDAEVDVAG